MDLLYLVIFFIFGTVFGSFFAVVGLRLPKHESFMNTRSHCDTCGHELKFYEMIPLFSYFIQGGKCRYCKAKIDSMLPFMEFFTGVLFATAYYSFHFSYELGIALGIVALLMIVVVSDLTYYIICDEILVFFSFYFFIFQFFISGIPGVISHIFTGLYLFILMYFVMLMGNKLFKKESLGGGDIKMMFLFGLILDPLLGTLSIFLGSLLALPISLFFLYRKKENMIPFGPFLILALAMIYFTKITTPMVISWLN